MCIQHTGYRHESSAGGDSTELEKHTIDRGTEKNQQQSGYNILYSNELIKNAKPVNVTIQSKDIREVMNTCLSGNALAYEIENGTILIKAQPAIPQSPSTQKIRGAVIETKTGMPLPGVTVVAEIEGKPLTGTATDADGHFEITLPSNIGELTSPVSATKQ